MLSVPARSWFNYQEPTYLPNRSNFKKHRGASFWMIQYITASLQGVTEKNQAWVASPFQQ